MREQPAYVVSDIHLGAVPERTEAAFRRFLRQVEAEASELLINGDLFDFWFEYRTVIHSRHYRVLAALADVVEAGVRVRFMGGNHDAWGGSFLSEQVGIELLPDRAEIELGGRRTLAVHGDGVGRGDHGYKLLKKVIRSPLATRAFRVLHPDLGSRLAGVASTTEGKHGNLEGVHPARAAELLRWATAEIEQRPELELILAGHVHTPIVKECAPGRFYVNTGDWINHFTYLVLPPGQPPELRVWPAD
jgi:UDP-2,3-diacylglucosamine hydrolase